MFVPLGDLWWKLQLHGLWHVQGHHQCSSSVPSAPAASEISKHETWGGEPARISPWCHEKGSELGSVFFRLCLWNSSPLHMETKDEDSNTNISLMFPIRCQHKKHNSKLFWHSLHSTNLTVSLFQYRSNLKLHKTVAEIFWTLCTFVFVRQAKYWDYLSPKVWYFALLSCCAWKFEHPVRFCVNT